MDTRYEYLLERVNESVLATDPFIYLHLPNSLCPADFEAITNSEQVRLPAAAGLDELFLSSKSRAIARSLSLDARSPGRSTPSGSKRPRSPTKTHAACEGQGMALRLMHPADETIKGLNDFFLSSELKSLLERKFGIEQPTTVEAGLQNYLHGYEISPLPRHSKEGTDVDSQRQPGD
jgi:hypothetical protein